MLWHFGINTETMKIAPFRHFHKWNFSKPKEATQYFKGQKVIKTLTQIWKVIVEGLPSGSHTVRFEYKDDVIINKLNREAMGEIFDLSFTVLLRRIYNGLEDVDASRLRTVETCYGTISNKIHKYNQRQAIRQGMSPPPDSEQKQEEQQQQQGGQTLSVSQQEQREQEQDEIVNIHMMED